MTTKEKHLERRQRMAGLLHQCCDEVRGIQQIAHADGDGQTMQWASHVGRELDELRKMLLHEKTYPFPP